MKITVIGDGAWGTALSLLLSQNQHEVTLWGYEKDNVEAIRRDHRNERFLPGIALPPPLRAENDLHRATAGSDCLVLAVPSKFFRSVLTPLSGYAGMAVTVTKGIEYETGLTMSGILQQIMPNARMVALSGPTLAMEVARGIPTACVAASADEAVAKTAQNLFNRPTFRVYTGTDLHGVELGGALKNVIAIAAGMSDGLGFGDNAKAALITRAIVEIRRLGTACGAQGETFSGLSGLGDLTVTCFSKLSRNRGFGERLGRGEKVEHILASTITVAEGYPTARSAHHLAQTLHVETPIINEVYAMLYEGKDIAQAVRDLMSRDVKAE